MKRADLFHPRVFSDEEWAEGYYQRNAKNIQQVGKRFVQLLEKSGFKGGRILDSGCGFGAVAIELAKGFAGQYGSAQETADAIAAAWENITDQIGREQQIELYKASLGL